MVNIKKAKIRTDEGKYIIDNALFQSAQWRKGAYGYFANVQLTTARDIKAGETLHLTISEPDEEYKKNIDKRAVRESIEL